MVSCSQIAQPLGQLGEAFTQRMLQPVDLFHLDLATEPRDFAGRLLLPEVNLHLRSNPAAPVTVEANVLYGTFVGLLNDQEIGNVSPPIRMDLQYA